MIYTADKDDDAWYIHGTNKGNFHFSQYKTTEDGQTSYTIGAGDYVYRAPWAAHPHFNKATKQAELQKVARDISNYAQYGSYRAARLFMGSSTFGDGARARLEKYKQRRQDSFPRNKFVKTITCSEAVILCYQMAFDEGDHPFFVGLDAA